MLASFRLFRRANSVATARRPSRPMPPPRRSVPIRRPSWPTAWCFARARSRSIRRPATSWRAASPSRPHQVLKNLRAVLKAAGSDLDRAVKTTVFLKSMDSFVAMNEVYGRPEYFGADAAGALDRRGGAPAARRAGRDRSRGAGLRRIGGCDPDRLAGRSRLAVLLMALLVVHVLLALLLIVPTWRICSVPASRARCRCSISCR